jgi:hypothetical protein
MVRNQFVRAGLLVAFGAASLAAAGCGIQGRWVGGDLKPEMARDQFNLMRPEGNFDTFVQADIRFQQDGTYLADLRYGDVLKRSTGTWELKEDKLTLVEADGHPQVFLIKQPDAATIKLTVGIKGSDVTLTLKKQN